MNRQITWFIYFPPNSVNSTYCQQELEYALSLNKRIIPLLVEEVPPEQVPSALRELHYIDLTDNVKEEDYLLDESELLKILHQDEPYYNEHKVLLTKALKWEQQHDNPSVLLRGYNLRSAETWLKVANKRTLHPPIPLLEEFIAESLRQPPATSLDVFISYSRADSDFARKLNEQLQLQGKTTWFDQESIASGADFAQEINGGIKACDNFLFILSPRSVNSPYCTDEVEYAAGLNKRFVTVLHRQVNPSDLHPELAKVQWIDFNQNQQDFNANFNQLVRTLDTDREHLRNHTKWSQRGIEWQEKGKSADLLLRGSELAVAEVWLKETQEQQKQPTATELQKAFIAKSGRHERKNRLLLTWGIAAVVGIMTAAAIGSTVLWQKAKRQTTLATLGENAATVKILLPAKPVEQLVLAIKITGESQDKLKQVLPQIQSSLYEAIGVARERYPFPGLEDWFNSVAISPDGKYVVTASSYDAAVRLWDIKGNPIGKPFTEGEDKVNSVAFSPDGQYIVGGSSDNTVRLWDIKGNPIGKPFTGHEKAVKSVAFSPDGQYIVSGSDDNTVRLWDIKGNPIGKPFIGHEERVNSVAFSPDGQYIVSGSGDNTVRLWDIKGNPMGNPFTGHEEMVNSVAFSPDGQYIISGSYDYTVRLWDIKGNPIGKPFIGHEGAVNSVAFSPDGQYIVSGSNDNTVRLWDIKGNPIGEPLKGIYYITSVAISSDGKTIVTVGSHYDTVRLWDFEGNFIGKPFTGHEKAVKSVAFSPDGKYIVSGSEDNTVRLWDTKGNSIGKPFTGHEDAVNSVAFSPNGKYIVSGSGSPATDDGDNTVRLWDIKGNPIGKPFTGHKSAVNSVAFSSDGKYIVSGSGSLVTDNSYNIVRLWDIKGNPIGKPFTGHEGAVNSVAFSPDGQYIVSGSSELRLWDIEGNLIGEPFTGHKLAVSSVAFSPNGKYIVSGSYDNTVRLWDIESNSITKIFTGHEDPVASVAFSPDGQYIVSGSHDNTVRLWDIQGNPITKIFTGRKSKVTSVAFSPKGKYIISGSDNNTARLWRGGNWEDWLDVACNRLVAHPILVAPETLLGEDGEMIKVAKEAHKTCQKLVWDKTENTDRVTSSSKAY